METLIKLVQLGPIGAGLAFSLLGYWLLRAEQKSSRQRLEMQKTIKYFISLSLATFVIGLLANLLIVFFDPHTQSLLTARLNSWEAKKERKAISFSILANGIDYSYYIPGSKKEDYRLIVAARPRSATPNEAGTYPLAFGEYAFDTIPAQVPVISAGDQSIFQTGCIDLVLFRVPTSALAVTPLKSPFSPSVYGSGLKVLYSAYDGDCP